MHIVIDIPKEKYDMIRNKTYCGIYDAVIYKAIANGIPLSKGHGRIIDESQIPGDGSWDESDRLMSTPTIIPADTESGGKE